jgi:hypothetical protein
MIKGVTAGLYLTRDIRFLVAPVAWLDAQANPAASPLAPNRMPVPSNPPVPPTAFLSPILPRGASY